MTRFSHKIYNTQYPYFVTCSIVNRLPILAIPQAVEIVRDSLIFLQKKRGFHLFAYVIMPDHIHLIARGNQLQSNIRNFKSFTAREIIDLLDVYNHPFDLRKFRKLKRVHHYDTSHQLWQEGYHPRQLADSRIMTQKMKYIHRDPVKKGYVDKPEQWIYSSAKNYRGEEGVIPVTRVEYS